MVVISDGVFEVVIIGHLFGHLTGVWTTLATPGPDQILFWMDQTNMFTPRFSTDCFCDRHLRRPLRWNHLLSYSYFRTEPHLYCFSFNCWRLKRCSASLMPLWLTENGKAGSLFSVWLYLKQWGEMGFISFNTTHQKMVMEMLRVLFIFVDCRIETFQLFPPFWF